MSGSYQRVPTLRLARQSVASFEPRGNERGSLSISLVLVFLTMSNDWYVFLFLVCLSTVFLPRTGDCTNVTDIAEQTQAENALAKLVKMFSKPGAFKQIDAILGENTIEASFSSCPMGEEGLECRRAEARRSVDCPRGDCFCYDCAAAGPDLWASCCRESLRCCSHLAAACRTCDHPTLYPFCAKHFKKCLTQYNENKQD